MSDIIKRVVNGFQLSDGSAATLIDDNSVNRDNTWSSQEIIDRVFPDISETGVWLSSPKVTSALPFKIRNDTDNTIEVYHIGKNFFGHQEGFSYATNNYSLSYTEGNYIIVINNPNAVIKDLMSRGNPTSGRPLDVSISRLIPPGTYTFSVIVHSARIRNESGELEENEELKEQIKSSITLKIGERRVPGLEGISTDLVRDEKGTTNLFFDLSEANKTQTLSNWGYLATFGFNLASGEGVKGIPQNAEIVISVSLIRSGTEPAKLSKGERRIYTIEAQKEQVGTLMSEEDTFYCLDNKEFSVIGKKDLNKTIQELENAILRLGGNI